MCEVVYEKSISKKNKCYNFHPLPFSQDGRDTNKKRTTLARLLRGLKTVNRRTHQNPSFTQNKVNWKSVFRWEKLRHEKPEQKRYWLSRNRAMSRHYSNLLNLLIFIAWLLYSISFLKSIFNGFMFESFISNQMKDWDSFNWTDDSSLALRRLFNG